MRLLVVVAALMIDSGGRILIAQRPEGKAMAGLWEFPGGKVEADESPEDALVRELYEELGADAKAADLTPFTFASHRYDDFHLLMPVYTLRAWRGTLAPKDVAAIEFVRPENLVGFPMPAADAPLVDQIITAFGSAHSASG
ncbi:MAG: (deoxy)nucleoside triphosphate pyrophosphohydrolase [Pseudomonadota bacterium]